MSSCLDNIGDISRTLRLNKIKYLNIQPLSKIISPQLELLMYKGSSCLNTVLFLFSLAQFNYFITGSVP
jgi:hypothetical protein